MNKFLVLAFLFFIGCIVGWVMELFFRRYAHTKDNERRWVNPGFLTGPYLPLYGLGLVALYLLVGIKWPFMEYGIAGKIVTFILMAVAMTLLEYITGIIFIIKLKVRLWDYSHEWANVKGIICPLFSLMWAVLGAVYYFLIHPYILDALAWLSKNLAFSFVIGFFYGVFVIDVIYSFNILSKVKKFADEYEIVVYYNELKRSINETKRRSKEKIKFMFIFNTEQPLREHLNNYKEKLDRQKEKFEKLPLVKKKKKK